MLRSNAIASKDWIAASINQMISNMNQRISKPWKKGHTACHNWQLHPDMEKINISTNVISALDKLALKKRKTPKTSVKFLIVFLYWLYQTLRPILDNWMHVSALEFHQSVAAAREQISNQRIAKNKHNIDCSNLLRKVWIFAKNKPFHIPWHSAFYWVNLASWAPPILCIAINKQSNPPLVYSTNKQYSCMIFPKKAYSIFK